MTNYNYPIDPVMVDIIKRIASSLDDRHPSEGTIVSVDGVFADVRSGRSSTIYRHCPVIGDPSEMIPGQIVGLRWVNQQPYVVASSLPRDAITPRSYNPDGVTIENSPYGMRVKPGGLQLSHMAFVPSLEGHTHKDSLTNNGWVVDDDGTISQGDINIHPTGMISVGLSPNVLKLDATHATYRFWIGNVDPASADFAVTKAGGVIAKSGSIAGWDILSDRLSKNNAEILAAGEITLGTGNDIAALSAVNVDDYRLWIGHASPASAPFRVSKTGEVWLDNAHIAATLQSSNYISGQTGWKIDSSGWAEFQNIIARGTFTAVTFQNAITSVLSGRQIVTDGATFISDVGTPDTTIDVDVNILEVDDILHTQPRPGVLEWMKITAGPSTITGGFRYTVTRAYDGGTAQQFYEGENIYRKGRAVDPVSSPRMGAYEAYMGEYGAFFGGMPIDVAGGFLTLEGSRTYGPYFGVARRWGPQYDQIDDIMRIGRLQGFLGVTDDEYGFGIGDADRNMTYTHSDGLVLTTREGKTVIDDEGVLSDKVALTPEFPRPDYIYGQGIIFIDSKTKTLRIRYKDAALEVDKLILQL